MVRVKCGLPLVLFTLEEEEVLRIIHQVRVLMVVAVVEEMDKGLVQLDKTEPNIRVVEVVEVVRIGVLVKVVLVLS